MKTCRILNGMWQLSGGHGFRPDEGKALQAMGNLVDGGFTSFDLADHYGPAEDFVGDFRTMPQASKGQFFTKWVPRPARVDRATVDSAIGQSLRRMGTERLDLLQVQYSILDKRPGQLMAPLCEERGVKLLCYGTVLGGLLSEKWIGRPEPSRADFKTVSEMK
ncbi:unnamed protein product, partial [Discosporangium mesarthrocarpum]